MEALCIILIVGGVVFLIVWMHYVSHLSVQIEKILKKQEYDFWRDVFWRIQSAAGIMHWPDLFYDWETYDDETIIQKQKVKNRAVTILWASFLTFILGTLLLLNANIC